MAVLLQLDNLTKHYGDFAALRSISVDVQPGCVGLLGPNGAGKSTLIRTLLGLLDFSEGHAKVLGHDVRSDPMSVRQYVGYMPEHETLFPHTTGLEMVAYAGELAGLPREEAMAQGHQMLDYAGMGEERYRPVETFSTGMKQRVKLAQALAHGPELVFLDEPTNGLDPMGREDMLAIISDLAGAGVNVLLSSHLLRDVERVCHSLVLMHEGTVVHYGSIADFKAGEIGQVEIEVRGGAGSARFADTVRAQQMVVEPAEDPDRWVVSVPDDEAIDTLWRLAVEGSYEVRHFARVTISLETAFMRFMGRGADG